VKIIDFPQGSAEWAAFSRRSFIASKGGDAEFQPVQLTDEAMDKLAQAMGCAVEAMTFEPYPG